MCRVLAPIHTILATFSAGLRHHKNTFSKRALVATNPSHFSNSGVHNAHSKLITKNIALQINYITRNTAVAGMTMIAINQCSWRSRSSNAIRYYL